MWWDPWQNFGERSSLFPFMINALNGDDNQLKNRNDSYYVYVNGDFVGKKESLTQADEGPSAIQDYLHSRGFNEFKVEMDGNSIQVESDEKHQSEDIKRHLAVYLSIR